jgi:hypothetical protein
MKNIFQKEQQDGETEFQFSKASERNSKEKKKRGKKTTQTG